MGATVQGAPRIARSLCPLARVEFAPGVCLPAPERERGSRSFLVWGLAGAHSPGEQKATERRERETRVRSREVRQGPCFQRALACLFLPSFASGAVDARPL